jgi:hypothetical protein
MGGKRCAALKQIAPRHSARVIAKPGRGGSARRQFGKIDRIRGGGGKAQEKAYEEACSNNCLHPRSSLNVSWIGGLNGLLME